METHEIYLSHGFQSNLKGNVSVIRHVWVYFVLLRRNDSQYEVSDFLLQFVKESQLKSFASLGRIQAPVAAGCYQGLGDTVRACSDPKEDLGLYKHKHKPSTMSVCTAPGSVAVPMATSSQCDGGWL